jgi:hypothetical protein
MAIGKRMRIQRNHGPWKPAWLIQGRRNRWIGISIGPIVFYKTPWIINR